jgi:glycosyltransferase involved in cell wall biosynthesis
MAAVDKRSWPELPLVSVITPAYNRESLLDEVIRSVLSQDYPNVEYIVLDDGSTDGTLDIIRKYDGRIRWATHENMGEARTVNKGFDMAQGEIIGVVNSDDPLLPGAVGTMVVHLLANPEILVVYPDWVIIGGDGKTVQNVTTHEYDYVDMLRWHHCVPGPGTFFRRVVAERLRGRDPSFRFVGDFDFWLRAGLLGPFARVPVTLATFRQHSESYSTNQLGQVMADEHIRMIDKLFANPDLIPEVRKVRREAYSSAYYIAGTQCGGELWSTAKRPYFLRALLYAPQKYLWEYRGRWIVIAPALLGPLYPPLRRPLKAAYRNLRRTAERLSRRRDRSAPERASGEA